jgi:electron-transferring-flavoprotein dehydrogenase
MSQKRESYPLDVLFVGGGPASLAGALRLTQLINKHNEAAAESGGAAGSPMEVEIGVLEKAREFGQHGISGAVLNPIALSQLIPDFKEKGAPLGSMVQHDAFYMLTRSSSLKVPDFMVPPDNDNKGFYTLSLQRFTKWLAEQAEAAGIFLFPGTTGIEILYDDGRVSGVRTGDKGLDKDGGKKGNFEPGLDLIAKATVFGEGPRGTLSEDLTARFNLREDRNPQIFSLGTKEIIKVKKTAGQGLVLHTLGYPLQNYQFGGGFLYEMDDEHYSLGFVASLAWRDPRFDCHAALQQWKKHSLIQSFIKGGEVISYGAKTIPEGGYFSVPKLHVDGALLVGDSAGLVNVKQIKGIHYAMSSGMMAADAIFEALKSGDFSSKGLSSYQRAMESSYVMKDLWRDRNFRVSFEKGLLPGLVASGLHRFTGGGTRKRIPLHPDHTTFRPASELAGMPAEPAGFDPGTVVDKLTDVFKSGTIHREDQPSHISILDTSVCTEKCIPKFEVAPCTNFCPANVYELVGENAEKKIHINFSNCVHCKTCVILDPFDIYGDDNLQNINWRAPNEGGPKYLNL